MYKTSRFATLGACFVLAACRGYNAGALDEPECRPLNDETALSVDMTATRNDDGSVRLTGHVRGANTRTIRTVAVAGVPAQLTGSNFSSFTVVLAREQVPDTGADCTLSDAGVLDDRSVCLGVVMHGSCGGEVTRSVAVAVDRTTVELTRDVPAALIRDVYMIPSTATSTEPLVVNVTVSYPARVRFGLGPAAGGDGAAHFTSSRGPTQLQVDVDSTVSQQIFGSRRGSVVLSVEAPPEAARQFAIAVAGPPVYSPETARLVPGRFTVESEAGLSQCVVSVGAEFAPEPEEGSYDMTTRTLSFAGSPLTARLQVVSAAEGSHITCTDIFGQRLQIPGSLPRVNVTFNRADVPPRIAGALVVPASGRSPLAAELDARVPGQVTLQLRPATGSDGSARFRTTRGATEIALDVMAGTGIDAAESIVGTRAGSVILSVTATPDPVREYLVIVAGGPRIAPAGGTMEFDEPLDLSIDSEAGLARCSTTLGTLTLADQDSADGTFPGATFVTDGTLVVPAPPVPPTSPTAVSIECVDAFGQTSRVEYSVM